MGALRQNLRNVKSVKMDGSDEAPSLILELFDRGSNCSADAGGRAV